MIKMMNPIDIVIPWVDGSDPAWIAQHNEYKANKISDNHISRFRAWDSFRYWFRAIEENAPWIRRVHLITWGHLPEWINTQNDKLNIVNHRDYVPDKYLPTFSSHVIELNLHRINELSENFIYFNDDVFLNQSSNPEDFFIDGKPRDSAIMGVIKNDHTENFMPYIMLNMMAIMNMRFNKRETIHSNIKKWFNLRYGKYNLNNLYLMPFGCFTGFRNFHGASSFCKQTYFDVWNEYGDILDEVCTHKFRSKADVNQYIFKYWQMMTGNFEPAKPSSEYYTVGKTPAKVIAEKIINGNSRILCINDDPGDFDLKKEQGIIDMAFEKRYSKKSSFEK